MFEHNNDLIDLSSLSLKQPYAQIEDEVQNKQCIDTDELSK